ncbi:MAG: hypothetical protein IJP29_05810 [Lachnospiraceae bacterium]|nr:hypothetical protein [Lachnospiraceae bacterium]
MFLLFILFFLGCGTLLIAGPICNIMTQRTCTQKVMARYVTCKTNNHIGTILPVTYTPCFEYNWNGKEYHVMPIDGELSKKRIMDFHSDQQYQLYIDKNNPGRVSLKRGLSHVGVIELVMGLSCYGAIGITMFLLFIEMIES